MPVWAALAGLTVLAPVASATADTMADSMPGPPYVSRTSWQQYGDGLTSLRVYPTPAGREVAGGIGKTAAQADEAWSEVLALAPNANTPGMRAQFICHWNFAELAEPGKTSWDLEPWRPAVDDNAMVLAGCNPGGADKRF